LNLSVHAEATAANDDKTSHRRKAYSGVYALTTSDLRKIIDSIAGRWGSAELLLRALDERGPSTTWFRISRQFGQWLRSATPAFEVDGMVA
jgi:hypothetical protein